MGIYLDNAATSYPKPEAVANAVYDFMVNNGSSSGRGSYKKAMQSDYIVYECRKLIGKLFNFNDPKKVVFTSNITDSLNIVMRGILKENDHVITSSLEHNAVWRCLKTLEKERNIKIDTVECTEDGITNPEDVRKYIKDDTALIVFTHASNVLGTVQPIREIGKIARENNITFLVDAAQSAGAMKIDVKEDNIDILAFTGHKSLMGPMGTGGLVINTDIYINPQKAGGTGGDSSYEYQPEYYPNHLEAGTSNVSGIAGLREAVKFLNKVGVENIHSKEMELTKYALEKLQTVKDIEIYGPKDITKMLSVISFNIKDKRPEDIGSMLDQKYDIMLRAGLHCAPTAHDIIGTKKRGTLRIGIGYFNEKEDIDKLVDALNNL